MNRQRRRTRYDVTVERELGCYPPDARRAFLRDPVVWLPGKMTMHGASTFRSDLRLWGMALDVEFRVGTPWTRGTSTTRRLQVEVVHPPLGAAWMLRPIDGDLTLLGEQRLRLRFEGAVTGARARSLRRWSARRMMRALLAGVAARLSMGAVSPPPPSSGTRR